MRTPGSTSMKTSRSAGTTSGYGVTDRGGRIIGAGIFKSPFYKDDGRSEPKLRSAEDIAAWPWRIDIEMLLSLWHAHRGPTIDAIDVAGTKMRRRSHLRLTEEQYLAGVDALAEAARPTAANQLN